MKHHRASRPLTFGNLIAGIFHACDHQRALGIVRLAVNAGLLEIPRRRRPAAAASGDSVH